MATTEKMQTPDGSLHQINGQNKAIGARLRQVRQARGLSLEKLASLVGISKQQLSRYELGERMLEMELLHICVEELDIPMQEFLKNIQAEIEREKPYAKHEGKPFYEIFMDISDELGLDIPGMVRVTGLTDREVRSIIIRHMKDAPLPIAMRLSETLNIPLEVWAGMQPYRPTEVSAEAYEVARAYDKVSRNRKNIARLAVRLKELPEK